MFNVFAQRLHRLRWLLILAPHLGQTRALRFSFSAVRGRLRMTTSTFPLGMKESLSDNRRVGGAVPAFGNKAIPIGH